MTEQTNETYNTPELKEVHVHTIDVEGNEIDISVQVFKAGNLMASSSNPNHVDIEVLEVYGDGNMRINAFSESYRNRIVLSGLKGSLRFHSPNDSEEFTGEEVDYDFNMSE